MEKKLNCWELKDCGCGPGGSNIEKRGLCPAVGEKRLDGVHGGFGGGRACWMVDGTFCDKRGPRDFISKYPACMNCHVYWTIRDEEGESFFLGSLLMQFMKGEWRAPCHHEQAYG